MKVALLTTPPNDVATALRALLHENFIQIDINSISNKSDTIVRMLHCLGPDILITYRCPYIVPVEIINAMPYGAFNIHPSLLPLYKGLNPWEKMFCNQEKIGGVTLHRLTADIDGGAVVLQKTFEILSTDTIVSARAKADKIASEMIREFMCRKCLL